MRFLAAVLLLTVTTAAADVPTQIPSPDKIEIRNGTTGLIYLRFPNPLKALSFYCYRLETRLIPQLSSTTWESLPTVALRLATQQTPLTADELTLCRQGLPTQQYLVAPYQTLAYRVVYEAITWKAIDRIAVGAVCESDVITVSGTTVKVEYHYVTGESGKRGLAPCVLTTQ